MRLYLSSRNLGNYTDHLLQLLRGGTKVALVLNASDGEPEDRIAALQDYTKTFSDLGLELSEIDLRMYFDKKGELREALKGFDLLWVRGGNTFVLSKAFAKSGFGDIVKDMLSKDEVVYGGSSAGCVILSPSLHGVQFADPIDVIPEGYPATETWEALGVLSYYFIPHKDSPIFPLEMYKKTIEYYEEKGLAYKTLRDGEVIVVDGDTETFLKIS